MHYNILIWTLYTEAIKYLIQHTNCEEPLHNTWMLRQPKINDKQSPPYVNLNHVCTNISRNFTIYTDFLSHFLFEKYNKIL